MSEIVYELTELKGDDVRVGNYIRPTNFRTPDFCDGCPLAEGLYQPRISRVREAVYPDRSIQRLGTFADFIPDALVLHDEDNMEFEPVYLGEEPVPSPFSVDYERPTSQALGNAHRKVDACDGPRMRKRLFRSDLTVCSSGLIRVKNFQQIGNRLVVPPKALREESNIVVGEGTTEYMERLLASARERQAAGRTLKEPFGTPESLKAMGVAHEVILKTVFGLEAPGSG